jgi:hypothetical protein
LSAVGLLLLAAIGCERPARARINFYRQDSDVRQIRRVVLVQLDETYGYPEISAKMTRALYEELQKQNLFHVDILPSTHPDLRDLDMNKREPYTMDELSAIRDSLRCDAVLFGSLTSYRPYPSTQVGLYLRLLDLRDGRLAWAAEHVWDSRDKDTVQRIKQYYFYVLRETYEPAGEELGYMSTNAFQKFVSYELVGTLNPDWKDQAQPRGYFDWTVDRFGRCQKNFWHDTSEDL